MTGKGRVYLVGSLRGSMASDVLGEALAALAVAGTPRPRVLVSYAPVADNADTIPFLEKTLARVFEGTGAEVERWLLPGEPEGNRERARQALFSADVVVVGGGDPLVGARIFRESGADAWLREARDNGTTCAGIDAGAVVLGAWWAEWNENDEGELVRCTGVLPNLVVDCQDEEDDWQELRLVAQMVEEHAPVRLLGIPVGGAVIVAPDDSLEVVGDEPLRLEAV